MIGDIIITIIFMIPLYGFLIWTYYCPEDSLLWGKRWMYGEEPEFSPNYIRYIKFASISTMIGVPIFLISMFLKPLVSGLVLIVFIFVILIGAFLIFSDESKS